MPGRPDSGVERRAFRSWDDFKRDLIPDLFGAVPFVAGAYLFRGCGDADWPLVSSFDRRFARLPTADRLAAWNSLVAAFRAECVEHGVPETIVADDRRLLAYGQHYGLPTRMLDWSLSPYVAAFFAFRDALSQAAPARSVAVWVLDTRSPAWTSDLGVEVVAPPAVENLRLRNQAGRFTLARTPHPTLEEHVRHCDLPSWSLLQLALPAQEAARALPDLDAMGVNAARLFPDVTGLAEGVALRLELASLPAP